MSFVSEEEISSFEGTSPLHTGFLNLSMKGNLWGAGRDRQQGNGLEK